MLATDKIMGRGDVAVPLRSSENAGLQLSTTKVKATMAAEVRDVSPSALIIMSISNNCL